MLVSGHALAEPPADAPACSSCEPAMVAARLGVASWGFHDTSYYPPKGSSALGELEIGQWVTSTATLSLVGAYAAFTDVEPSGGGDYNYHWAMQVAKLGARVSSHDPDTSLFAGYGFGATLARGHDQTGSSERRDASHYVEAFAGAQVAHVGQFAFELSGGVLLGGVTSFNATLGVRWDAGQPPPVRCVDPPHDHVVAALRGGVAHTEIIAEDSSPEGWGPWIEGEVGWRTGPHRAFLGVASFTRFTGNEYYDSNNVPKTFSMYRLGMREQLWPTRRAFVALGGGAGIVTTHAASPLPGTPGAGIDAYLELVLGVELVRSGDYAIDLTSQGSLSPLGAGEASFALGVAWR